MTLTRTLRIALVVAVALALACRGDTSGERAYPGAREISLSDVTFDDGDTFYFKGEPIRILGFDTPETRSPGVGIMIDQPFGPEAAESTRALMTRARRIELVLDGRGTYGRRLAHVFVDGELLAVKLIEMGLAYESVSHFGDNGFPDLADQILEAADRSPKPKFQQPYKWRKKNQKKR